MGARFVTEHLICRNCIHYRGCGDPESVIDVCDEHGFHTYATYPFCPQWQCGDWSDIERGDRLLFDDGSTYQTTNKRLYP